MASSRNPAQTAAQASLLAPLCAIGLSCLLNGARQSAAAQDPQVHRMVAVASAIALGVLILLGLGAGIAALAMMGKHGRQGVLVQAFLGLAFNLFVLGLGTAGLVLGRQMANHQLASQHVDAANAELLDAAQKALEKGPTTASSSPKLAPALLGNAADAAEESARTAHGAERALMSAIGMLMRQEQAQLSKYQEATGRFNAVGGLSPEGISKPEDIQQRLAMIDEWDQANESLGKTISNGPALVRAEMVKGGASQEDIKRAQDMATRNLNLDLNAQIREDERLQVKGARALMALYKEQWGKWHYDKAAKLVRFSDDDALARFSQIMDQVKQAVADQQAAQKQLAERLPPGKTTPATR